MLNQPQHPFAGRRRSDITEEELQTFTDEQYEEYIAWGIRNVLHHMSSEGMVTTSSCPNTGEPMYTISAEFKNSVVNP